VKKLRLLEVTLYHKIFPVMKRIYLGIVIIILFALMPLLIKGQCKSFAKKICLMDIVPAFVHDGNYHAAILTEGEEAELYKTFYSDTDYRIAICGTDALPDIEFEVIDIDRNVLYSNKESNYSRIWDFNLESSQQLKISIKVLVNKDSDEIKSGCVAIMFGFK